MQLYKKNNLKSFPTQKKYNFKLLKSRKYKYSLLKIKKMSF